MYYSNIPYAEINILQAQLQPAGVKPFNNEAFLYYQRALFQRLESIITIDGLPEEWGGENKDFFKLCLYAMGFVGVFRSDDMGLLFQPGTLYGYNIYYQPTKFIVANPLLNKEFVLHEDCELIKLTPDYSGVFDIVNYYAEKLANLDNALNMAITNSKLAYLMIAKNKASSNALKAVIDKMNRGDPAIIVDKLIGDDPINSSDPWFKSDGFDVKNNYILDKLLEAKKAIIDDFCREIGIPVNNDKKERMITSEAESDIMNTKPRVHVWFESLNSSVKQVNDMFDLNITFTLSYESEEGGADNGEL